MPWAPLQYGTWHTAPARLTSIWPKQRPILPSDAAINTSMVARAPPGFIYVAPRHAEIARPALSGWLGHDAPFAFEQSYRAGSGIERMRVGTPPVLALGALEAALDVWDMTTMADIRACSVALTTQFIDAVEAHCPMLTLASPRDSNLRGSQVSFRFDNGYAAMQALIDRGVVGDFRAPDIMRFGFTPLYIDAADCGRGGGYHRRCHDPPTVGQRHL